MRKHSDIVYKVLHKLLVLHQISVCEPSDDMEFGVSANFGWFNPSSKSPAKVSEKIHGTSKMVIFQTGKHRRNVLFFWVQELGSPLHDWLPGVPTCARSS